MIKKKVKKTTKRKVKKVEKDINKEAGLQEVQANLGNVFQIALGNLSSLLLRVDKLQKTVDAIGLLLAEHAIKKD